MIGQNHTDIITQSYLAQKMALIAGMTFLGINYGMVMLWVFFMAFDTVFGIAKSVTIYGWESIKANRFWIGIVTKMGVLFVPLSIALTGLVLGFDFGLLITFSMYTLISNDAISCYTNLLSIKKKRDYENKDLIEMLINFIRNLIYNSINNMMQKIKDGNGCDINQDKNDPKD